ncbi:SulP family inorganic anion transporter [Streptomyces lavendulae]|uniref:Putative sulfate transporter n=1 Tax=Streptomyces lavendulae subsp. lavendulae TaxID=58340 RepID=A0A2K8P964_STRLA|nr:sulfate permease [Streptomyces lavendulae]ATZ23287.1 putative sulfate transporter [Streptomyces lavendulae subsp. lavendulae]QUQ53118.1 putative sulfate transporter [Streptomyces lavendulae subsp. lavendulae]
MPKPGRAAAVPPALHGYRAAWLRGDVPAGITVAAYLVPQVMAYAGVAGLPPVVGLWAALPAMVLYALSGSSRLLSVGPESTTALMTAVAVGPVAAGDPARYAVLSAALAVVVGLLSLVAWAVRLGFLADLLSRPVLVGYLAGVALIMIVAQLPRLTGTSGSRSDFFPQLLSFLHHLGDVHRPTAVLAAGCLVLLFALPLLWRPLPGPLVVLALATAVVVGFALDENHGINVIGAVPSGLPGFALPDPSDYADLVLPAVGVLLVGYSDVVLTARAFARHDDPHPLAANRELLALGVSNIGAGVLHGFPVSSSASRTALADSAGARTQVYSLVGAACVAAVLLFLGPLLAHTPSAALGAIVVYAAVRLIEVGEFRRLAAFRRRELLLAIGCTLGVLALGILYGVLVAVALSVIDLLARVARPHDAVLGIVPGLAGMHDIDDYPTARTIPGLLIYRYDSPLFFANAEDFRRRAVAAVDEQDGPVHWFVLNTEANVEVDITALDAVEALRSELVQRDIVFAFARVKQELREPLDAYGLTAEVGANRIYPTLPTAIAGYHAWQRADDRGSGP